MGTVQKDRYRANQAGWFGHQLTQNFKVHVDIIRESTRTSEVFRLESTGDVHSSVTALT
jgi:hypothetical protein